MRTGAASAANAVGARRHNENDATMTIAGLWRHSDWRHVATGCTALVPPDRSCRDHVTYPWRRLRRDGRRARRSDSCGARCRTRPGSRRSRVAVACRRGTAAARRPRAADTAASAATTAPPATTRSSAAAASFPRQPQRPHLGRAGRRRRDGSGRLAAR